jgi:hypothetical protein
MKVNVILKLARQVEGDRVFLHAIKASTNKDSLHKYLRELNMPATEEIDGIGCIVELGMLEDIEVDVE